MKNLKTGRKRLEGHRISFLIGGVSQEARLVGPKSGVISD